MESRVTHDVALADPRLDRFSLSERRAILMHKYLLGTRLGYDPGLTAAVADWEKNHAKAWREAKMRGDLQEQFNQIEKHKYYLSEKAGYDVGWEFAIWDWMKKYANDWRRSWEELPESGA